MLLGLTQFKILATNYVATAPRDARNSRIILKIREFRGGSCGLA